MVFGLEGRRRPGIKSEGAPDLVSFLKDDAAQVFDQGYRFPVI